MQISAFDYFSITSRKITDEGYLIAPGQLARTGVQEYRAMELGLTDGNPMRKVRLYRPADEVFDADSMASFEHKPVTIEHPAEGVTAANWRDLSVGDVRSVARAGDFMTATIILKSQAAIDALEGGKRELSNGYNFELDMTPGTAPDGSAYDGVQRKIRGNHIALVDAARCGSACRVADSITPLETIQMTLQKITVDGIPLEVSDTAAAILTKQATTIADLTANLKMANDAMSKMVTADAHSAVVTELEKARKEVMTPAARDAMVATWAQLLADVKRVAPAVTSDGKTCHALRKEALTVLAGDAALKPVIDASLGGVTIDAASEDVVALVWRTAMAMKPAGANDSATATSNVADALLGGKGADKKEPQLVGRAAMMARNSAASK